ncbi:NUDIX hydrolase [Cryobacterium melibiosiphilum]|uniref:NUDIX hydrolase n=1 Tax=Cryobacterium melibiosiphilum TaxID=995039 RepID=A0A3A5MH32_9MICO|nr:NUDIX domain-containing protein [Cryobacterium melibiosiphilum]RJT88405.1 NUDIX hydrolase [Cryobacterium melibiosiphilum]
MTSPRANTLAVSTVIFALRPRGAGPSAHVLWVPLVRRTRDPFLNQWALPGGWLSAEEELEHAASRTLEETTGLAPKFLEQLFTFGDLDRTPGDRVVSIVYWALVQPTEADRAIVDDNVRWFAADALPQLAFDHNRIVAYALWRLRTKMEYSRIAQAFLGTSFTLAQLREVHEAVLLRPLDPANFRRSMESSGTLIDTGERVAGARHRPPRLYRYTSTEPTPPTDPTNRHEEFAHDDRIR